MTFGGSGETASPPIAVARLIRVFALYLLASAVVLNGGLSGEARNGLFLLAGVLVAVASLRTPQVCTPGDRRLFAYLAWTALSAAAGSIPGVSSEALLGVALPALLALALARSYRDAGEVERDADTLLVGAAVFGAIGWGIWMWSGRAVPGSPIFLTFPLQNYAATFFLLPTALGLGAATDARRTTRERLRAAALTIPSILCLAATDSRGAIGGLGLVMVILGYHRLHATWRRLGPARSLAVGLLGVSILAGAFLAHPRVRDRLLQSIRTPYHRDSPRGRSVIWPAAIDIGRGAPWLGEGPGTFAAVVFRFARIHVLDAHNVLLEHLATTGVPGLVLYLLVLARLTIVLLRRARAERSGQACVFLAYLAGVGFQNLFTPSETLPATCLTFYIGIGWMLALERLPIREPAVDLGRTPDAGDPPIGRTLARSAVIGLLGVVPIVWIAPSLVSPGFAVAMVLPVAGILSLAAALALHTHRVSDLRARATGAFGAVAGVVLLFAVTGAAAAASAWNGEGVRQLGHGAPRQAATLFRRAVSYAPGQGAYALNLATALRAVGEHERADDALAHAALRLPEHPLITWNRGVLALEDGRTGEAELAFALVSRLERFRVGSLLRTLLRDRGISMRSCLDSPGILDDLVKSPDLLFGEPFMDLAAAGRSRFVSLARSVARRLEETRIPVPFPRGNGELSMDVLDLGERLVALGLDTEGVRLLRLNDPILVPAAPLLAAFETSGHRGAERLGEIESALRAGGKTAEADRTRALRDLAVGDVVRALEALNRIANDSGSKAASRACVDLALEAVLAGRAEEADRWLERAAASRATVYQQPFDFATKRPLAPGVRFAVTGPDPFGAAGGSLLDEEHYNRFVHPDLAAILAFRLSGARSGRLDWNEAGLAIARVMVSLRRGPRSRRP